MRVPLGLTWTLWSCVSCRATRFTVHALAVEASCEHGRTCPWHDEHHDCTHVNPKLTRFLVGAPNVERADRLLFGLPPLPLLRTA